jgi:CcmD family protein
MNPLPPNANHYLYAAYAVVWVIHTCYALTLYTRGKRLERESRELKRD